MLLTSKSSWNTDDYDLASGHNGSRLIRSSLGEGSRGSWELVSDLDCHNCIGNCLRRLDWTEYQQRCDVWFDRWVV